MLERAKRHLGGKARSWGFQEFRERPGYRLVISAGACAELSSERVDMTDSEAEDGESSAHTGGFL